MKTLTYVTRCSAVRMTLRRGVGIELRFGGDTRRADERTIEATGEGSHSNKGNSGQHQLASPLLARSDERTVNYRRQPRIPMLIRVEGTSRGLDGLDVLLGQLLSKPGLPSEAGRREDQRLGGRRLASLGLDSTPG
jgi:hypothetical protein